MTRPLNVLTKRPIRGADVRRAAWAIGALLLAGACRPPATTITREGDAKPPVAPRALAAEAGSASVAGSTPLDSTGRVKTRPTPAGPTQLAAQLAAAELDASARRDAYVRARIERKQRRLASGELLTPDQPAEAAEFFELQRLPQGMLQYPTERVQQALHGIRAQEALQQSQRGVQPGGVLGWQSIGPGNIGGRTRAIVIHPTQPEIMYAAGVTGGVWKTTDAGASWRPLDDFLLNIFVCSLVMDPTNPNVLYAGTGEGYFSSDQRMRGLGIYKTIDAGETWSLLRGTIEGVPQNAFHYVNKLAISPNDHNRIFAATRTGVWRSSDAGQSWQVVLSNPTYVPSTSESRGSANGCTDLVIRGDAAPDVILAAFGVFDDDGLFRSVDGGETWDRLGGPSDLLISGQGRMSLAMAPSNNDVIYVCMANQGGQLLNIFRSVDGGATWEPRLDLTNEINPWLLSNLVLGTGCFSGGVYSQGWYDNIIAVDPLNPDVVWVGGIDLFRSDDAGRTFRIASYWFEVPGTPPYVHADQHAIVFHPNYNGTSNQTLFIGNDGGIYRTDNARGVTSTEDCPFGRPSGLGIQWTSLNNGYGVTQFYHGDSARDRDWFGGGTQDNGSLMVRAADEPNTWQEVLGGDGGYFAINPLDSEIVFAETQDFPTMVRSDNGGQSFGPASAGITDRDGLFINPFAMDPTSPNILWTGGTRPWRTFSSGQGWSLGLPAEPRDPFLGANISAIAIAPTNGNFVYLGFSNGYVARTGQGINGSAPAWTEFGPTNGLRNGYISSLAVSPIDPDTVYCTYSTFGGKHIYRTRNGGQIWQDIDGLFAADLPDIPCHWIAVRPCAPAQLYVGTELGVFASDNDGGTWTPVNGGLSHTIVETLDFQDDNTLVAFTHGRGAFRTRLAPCGDCNANGVPDDEETQSGAAPDCNTNGTPDECETRAGGGADCQTNGVPDACELDADDCNTNGMLDLCDMLAPDPPPAVQSDVCDLAMTVCPDTDYLGTLVGATLDGLSQCDPLGARLDVWYRYSPTESGPATVSLCGSQFDTVLSVHSACQLRAAAGGPGETNELTCNNDFCGTASQVSLFVQGGRHYYIRVVSRAADAGPFSLRVTGPPCGFAAPPDCNRNGVLDQCERDCNANGVPDDCDLAGDPGLADCNQDGVFDSCQIAAGDLADCNTNARPDVCELRDRIVPDCNTNSTPDACDIGRGAAVDCNTNRAPDSCELGGATAPDCNTNGSPDACDLGRGAAVDCNTNRTPDSCDLSRGSQFDCNTNRTPDLCDLGVGVAADCNSNGRPDTCDLAIGAADCNTNRTVDTCESDSDRDGVIDPCDGCPLDGGKTAPGACGCGAPETDRDGDGALDCVDGCPDNRDRVVAGLCGCEVSLAECAARIGCPRNVTIYATSSAGAVLDFGIPTFAGPNGPAEVTASHQSGAVFPVGDTDVSIVVRDPVSGDEVRCGFRVTVKGFDSRGDGGQTPPPGNPTPLCGVFGALGLFASALLCAGGVRRMRRR